MNYQTIYHKYFLIFLYSFINWFASFSNAQTPPWKIAFTEVTAEINSEIGRLNGNAILLINISDSYKGNISLELNRELKVISVTNENGLPLAYKRNEANLSIQYPVNHSKSDTLRLSICYEGSFTDRVPELNLLNASIGPQISYALYSSCWYPEQSGFRRSKGKIKYRVPHNWVVASVGKLVSEDSLETQKQFVFEINSPAEFSFVAAPFKFNRYNRDSLDVGVYLLTGDLKKAQYYLENCTKIVKFFKEYYGIFPYKSYSLIEIPQDLLGNAGGGSYENLTFYSSGVFANNFFFIPAFAHEIGHLWWSNLIQSSDGPVIKEGLAQLSMGLYLEHVMGEKVFRNILKNGAPELLLIHSAQLYFNSISSQKNSAPNMVSIIMRGEDLELGKLRRDKIQTLHMIANSKGFFIYIMLRDLIGEKAFQQGLRNVINRFAWSTITLNDLRLEFEKASDIDLKYFFDQWFFRKGAPEFSLEYNIESQSGNFKVSGIINQLRDLYKVKIEIAFISGEIHETRIIDINNEKTPFTVLLPFKPDKVVIDPDYKILRWTDEFSN